MATATRPKQLNQCHWITNLDKTVTTAWDLLREACRRKTRISMTLLSLPKKARSNRRISWLQGVLRLTIKLSRLWLSLMTWNQRLSILQVQMLQLAQAFFQRLRHQVSLEEMRLMGQTVAWQCSKTRGGSNRKVRFLTIKAITSITLWWIVTALGKCFLQWPNRLFSETQIKALVWQILRGLTQSNWKKDCSWPKPSWRNSMSGIRSSKSITRTWVWSISLMQTQEHQMIRSIRNFLIRSDMTFSRQLSCKLMEIMEKVAT